MVGVETRVIQTTFLGVPLTREETWREQIVSFGYIGFRNERDYKDCIAYVDREMIIGCSFYTHPFELVVKHGPILPPDLLMTYGPQAKLFDPV